jgi:hypothetical protein
LLVSDDQADRLLQATGADVVVKSANPMVNSRFETPSRAFSAE